MLPNGPFHPILSNILLFSHRSLTDKFEVPNETGKGGGRLGCVYLLRALVVPDFTDIFERVQQLGADQQG